MKKILGILFIIIGVAFICYAIGNRLYYDNINKKMVESYEKQYDNIEEITSFVSENESGEEISENIESEQSQSNVIGVIKIKKIDLEATISEGSDMNTLKYSVGHFENTPLPSDGGNFCILGHRSYTYGQFFNRINELERDDLINININGTDYTYQIYNIYETVPTDLSVLNNSKRDEITIVTCTIDGKNRVIVKGNKIF